jgi:uroporphyrinogen-III decarboxylase
MVGKSTHGEIHRPAIADWSELPALRPPDFSRPECYAAMRERFASAGDKYRLAFIGGWIFNDARYLRRLENYLEDMAAEPEMLDRLNAIVVKVYEDKIRGAAAAGADGIFYCEDLGTQIGLLFSPAMFRRFFKAEYARLVGLAHSLGLKVFLHSCGCNRDLLADLIDVGIDCFQFDQPMVYDLPALSEQLRAARRALWAPVDIQKVLPTGRREYIEAETVRLIHLFRGGLILKNYGDLPGIGVKPEWDNWFYQTALREAGLAQ